jgi:hypothetical protein
MGMKEITQQCMLKGVCECNGSSEYNSKKHENSDSKLYKITAQIMIMMP